MPTTPFYLQQFRFLDGSPASGGKLYATVQGTETPSPLYLDPQLTVQAPQPIVLGADGTVPQFWAPSAPGLCFKLKDPRGGVDTLVWTRDYVEVEAGANATGTVTSVGLSLGAAMDAIADVANSPITGSGDIEIELADQTQGNALMSPASSAGKPAFRQIVQSDIFAGMESSVLTLNSILSYGEAPPSSPSVGFYGLAYSMTGAFLGHDNELAYWNGSTWIFSVPAHGQKAYLPTNNGTNKAGFKRFDAFSGPLWMTLTQNQIYSEEIRGGSVMVGGLSDEVIFSSYSHPNAAAKVTGILVFDRAKIETTGIAFKTAGSSKYVSISGSDVNEREVDLRGFSTGTPLDEGVWTSLRLLNIKAINGVFTGSTPTERISALGAGFLTSLSCSGGIGAFAVTPPTTRPTVNAAATDLATVIALTNQLRAAMIGCGIVQ